MIKNLKWLLIVSFFVMLISSCESNADVSEVRTYNNVCGKVAECVGEIYYIKNNCVLSNIDNPQVIAENVLNIQEYNDKLYYVKEDNEKLHLMEYDGKTHKKNSELPEGIFRKIIIDNNRIYTKVENKLFAKKIEETNFSLIRTNVIDFVTNESKIYSIEGSMSNAVDSQKTNISDLSKINLSTKLLLLDDMGNEEKTISDNSSGFLVTPIAKGIVYYDRDELSLNLYKGHKSILLDKTVITSMLSYTDNIFYTAFSENSVYRMSLSEKKQEKVLDKAKSIFGLTKDFVYTSDGIWERY